MKTLVALGDSITWGFPYGEQESWLTKVSEEFRDLECINQGINGDTLEGMFHRLNRDVFAYTPDYCIVCGGINDAFSDYSMSAIEQSFKSILDKLSEKQVLAIVGIPINILPCYGNVEKKVEKIHELFLRIGREQKLPILDFRGLKAADFSDEVHPNKKGYGKMGEIAVKFFKSFYD